MTAGQTRLPGKDSDQIQSGSSHHPLLLRSPLAWKEHPTLQRKLKGAWLEGQEFSPRLLLPPVTYSAVPAKKSKFTIRGAATRR